MLLEAGDGIRLLVVTGVQTCALQIFGLVAVGLVLLSAMTVLAAGRTEAIVGVAFACGLASWWRGGVSFFLVVVGFEGELPLSICGFCAARRTRTEERRLRKEGTPWWPLLHQQQQPQHPPPPRPHQRHQPQQHTHKQHLDHHHPNHPPLLLTAPHPYPPSTNSLPKHPRAPRDRRT